MLDKVSDPFTAKPDRLAEILKGYGQATIAVSGGVDSMTLSSFAHRALGQSARMVHALSPAVPRAATARVRRQAEAEGWRLDVVDAGEFNDARYRANPVDRCFFCKSSLYETLGAMSAGVVLSGANCDDLGDYRPGLKAAENNDVRHPYIEAGFSKADVRALARRLDLPELAALPASPCLSSRIETGIPIEAAALSLIERMEDWLCDAVAAATVRCRIRKDGLVIELDEAALDGLGTQARLALIAEARVKFAELDGMSVEVAAYVRGSAFVGVKQLPSAPTAPAPTTTEFNLDFARPARLGQAEAIFCAQKSVAQIGDILAEAATNETAFLLTRLEAEKFEALDVTFRRDIDYDAVSGTGFYKFTPTSQSTPQVVIVTAGTSDADVAREAARTLEFNGVAATMIFDVGVAGLWRLLERIDEIRRHPVVIAVAGMDAALPSVLGGLVPGALIAVPTSTGYGVARAGETALNACLASCAPGITVCNIDNGYGAACAAMRVLEAARMVAATVTPDDVAENAES